MQTNINPNLNPNNDEDFDVLKMIQKNYKQYNKIKSI